MFDPDGSKEDQLRRMKAHEDEQAKSLNVAPEKVRHSDYKMLDEDATDASHPAPTTFTDQYYHFTTITPTPSLSTMGAEAETAKKQSDPSRDASQGASTSVAEDRTDGSASAESDPGYGEARKSFSVGSSSRSVSIDPDVSGSSPPLKTDGYYSGDYFTVYNY